MRRVVSTTVGPARLRRYRVADVALGLTIIGLCSTLWTTESKANSRVAFEPELRAWSRQHAMRYCSGCFAGTVVSTRANPNSPLRQRSDWNLVRIQVDAYVVPLAGRPEFVEFLQASPMESCDAPLLGVGQYVVTTVEPCSDWFEGNETPRERDGALRGICQNDTMTVFCPERRYVGCERLLDSLRAYALEQSPETAFAKADVVVRGHLLRPHRAAAADSNTATSWIDVRVTASWKQLETPPAPGGCIRVRAWSGAWNRSPGYVDELGIQGGEDAILFLKRLSPVEFELVPDTYSLWVVRGQVCVGSTSRVCAWSDRRYRARVETNAGSRPGRIFYYGGAEAPPARRLLLSELLEIVD